MLFKHLLSRSSFIIFPETSRIYLLNPRTQSEFIVGRNVILHHTQYLYLAIPVRITSVIPTRQWVHLIAVDLDCLQNRFIPVKWLQTMLQVFFSPSGEKALHTIPSVSC